MCGITGFWGAPAPEDALLSQARAMAGRLIHRGPDDGGAWVEASVGLGLAHRRLSIRDLSAAGHQPMPSAEGRYVLAYNGELYNHLALRRELEAAGCAPNWRGHSDTETLLACIEAWGVERALTRCVGMFAFAAWDRAHRELWLARDRMGEKPLYYGWQGGTFLFGSELRALRVHPEFHGVVDRGALALLLRHNYVPDPYSIWQGIGKLPAGTFLRLREHDRDARPVPYWSLPAVASEGQARPFQGSDAEALAQLEQLLGDAVQRQMEADVPLGALLSGGIDSTLIVSLMQSRSTRPVRTFTIGFEEAEFDEAPYARALAQHLGTEHTELRLSGQEALDLVPGLPDIYDEPFADSSQIPTHLVMRLARRHVAVALSGDAGDELFGGYNRYRFLPAIWKGIGWMPGGVRSGLLAMARCSPQLAGRIAGASQMMQKLDKIERLFRGGARDIDQLYVATVSAWDAPASVVRGGVLPTNLLDSRSEWPQLDEPVARMMAMDALTYLPGDILTKVDRAAMSVSLETRAPFLDRDVVEFAWRLPMRMKIRGGKGKWLLRQLLYKHVPRELVERPKQGFGIPLDDWLRGPLREWAEALLSEATLRAGGFFDAAEVRGTWHRHLQGEVSCADKLWSVLMFQAWWQAQGRMGDGQ